MVHIGTQHKKNECDKQNFVSRDASHNGKMLSWEQNDLKSLYDNLERFGMPAFTADFQKYDVSAEVLKERFPEAKILRVKSIETENVYNNPLNPEIIF